jgi:hypothetical protein
MFVSVKPAIGAWSAREAELAPLPTRGAYLRRAAAWDGRPEYFYRLGMNYFDLGMANPASRQALMRSGLPYAKAALELEPLNPDYLLLMGAFTWRLGRAAAGRSYAERSQALRFDPVVPDRRLSDRQLLRSQLEALRAMKMLPDEWRTR